MQGNSLTGLVLTKGSAEIVFDIVIPTHKGVLYCAYLHRTAEVAAIGPDGNPVPPVPMSIVKAHRQLGHCSEANTRAAAKALNWYITRGALKPCQACTIGKARQKNLPQLSDAPPSADRKAHV